MPILIFLRQYGLREYAITLIVAALVGLGIALLLNSAAGGAGNTGELTTKHELSVVSSAPPAIRVTKPVAKAVSAARAHAARKPVHHARRHRASHPAPAPISPQRLVATRTPAPAPAPKPTFTPAPAPKPAPVVHKPASKPKPAPAPKKRSGGGSGQFDDSG
jgi:outer membrane biosynthesis protein TonB